MGLQGTIETLPASEVLGALSDHGSTGVFEIRGDAGRLSLSLMGGFLVAGDLEGLFGHPTDRDGLSLRLVDVLCAMLRIESGSYEFRDGAIERPSEVRIELHGVLARASAVADALQRLNCSLPTLDSIPLLIETDEDAPITLNRSMLRLVAQVDGSRSISQIAQSIGLSAYETAVPVAELSALGILDFEHSAIRGAQRQRAAENLDSRIAEATRDSVALAASLAEAHRSPYTDVAERALADLAGGGDSLVRAGDPLRSKDERPATEDIDLPVSSDFGDEIGPETSLETEFLGSYLADELAATRSEVNSDEVERDEELAGDLEQTTITADRGALLRLFSGLRTDHG